MAERIGVSVRRRLGGTPGRAAVLPTLALALVLAAGPAGLGQGQRPAEGAETVEATGEGSGGEGGGAQEGGLGDWAGSRSWLAEAGLEVELHYTSDVLSNRSGGERVGTEVAGNVDLLLTADLERLLGLPGTLFLYGLGNHGGSISEAVGDLQGVSNIEAVETAKLFEAWYELDGQDGRWSVLAGLFDVNSEFDAMGAASLFVHSSQGLGADLGLSGVNGPSTFPFSALAARVQVRPTATSYVRAVVADGVPGDPADPEGTQIVLDGDEGLFLAVQAGRLERFPEKAEARARRRGVEPVGGGFGLERSGEYAVGVWGYTTEFDDFFRVGADGDPLAFRGTYGAYAFVERRLSYEAEDPRQGLSAYARVGLADDRANVVDGYVGAGAVYRGPIPGRDEDRLGLAVGAAHLGDAFRTGESLQGRSLESWEVAFELTYRARVAPWLAVQPDLQLIVDPGGDPELDDALVLGARFVVSL